MADTKDNKPNKEEVAPKEISKNWQEFTLLKDFPTDGKKYRAGETFKHYDTKVIAFLRTQKII